MKLFNIAQELTSKADQFLARFGTEKFHTEAADLLSKSSLLDSFDLNELAIFFLSSVSIEQNFKDLEFSDLPLTIARGEHCFIDLYFWRRRPTTIHNHHFNGAFMCLAGNNVDLEFSFDEKFSIGKFHQIGEIKLISERNIKAGDIAPINFLDKFIHQNHHQADLSVNLCFRTAERKNYNLANFLHSGLRYELDSALLTKTQQIRKLVEISNLSLDDLQLSNDEIMCFLLNNIHTTSLNPRILDLISKCEERLSSQFGVKIYELIEEHYLALDRLENNYI